MFRRLMSAAVLALGFGLGLPAGASEPVTLAYNRESLDDVPAQGTLAEICLAEAEIALRRAGFAPARFDRLPGVAMPPDLPPGREGREALAAAAHAAGAGGRLLVLSLAATVQMTAGGSAYSATLVGHVVAPPAGDLMGRATAEPEGGPVPLPADCPRDCLFAEIGKGVPALARAVVGHLAPDLR